MGHPPPQQLYRRPGLLPTCIDGPKNKHVADIWEPTLTGGSGDPRTLPEGLQQHNPHSHTKDSNTLNAAGNQRQQAEREELGKARGEVRREGGRTGDVGRNVDGIKLQGAPWPLQPERKQWQVWEESPALFLSCAVQATCAAGSANQDNRGSNGAPRRRPAPAQGRPACCADAKQRGLWTDRIERAEKKNITRAWRQGGAAWIPPHAACTCAAAGASSMVPLLGAPACPPRGPRQCRARTNERCHERITQQQPSWAQCAGPPKRDVPVPQLGGLAGASAAQIWRQ